MRKQILSITAALLALLITSVYAGYHAPHNATNAVSCGDCHSTAVDDNTCLQCHINATGGGYSKNSAPKVDTHSSLTVTPEGGTSKYGAWTVRCIDCHWVHHQQSAKYGADSYLATGAIASVTDNGNGTTTFGYSSLSMLKPGWSDVAKWGAKTADQRGLIIYPNIATTNVRLSFEVLSATASTITVQGSIAAYAAGSVVPGNTFALIYGQNVMADLAYSTTTNPSGTVPVRLFNQSGAYSFAHDESGTAADPTPDGICQVCHDKTTHWKNNGSLAAVGVHSGLNGSRCTVCHKHEDGFSAASACNSCHGFPPADATVGGPNGLVSSDGGTGSTSPGAHAKHATSTGMNYPCTTCHSNGMPDTPIYDKILQIGFDFLGTLQSGTYDGRTAPANGYMYGAGNTGTTVTQGGTQTCTVYCHSDAQSDGGGSLTAADYKSPVWTGSVRCGECHAGDGVQGNRSLMISGSHGTHVNASRKMSCSECHNGYGSGSPQHINSDINMAFKTNLFGASGSYSQSPNAPGNGYGSCSNVYCHSTVQKEGGASLVAGTPDYKSPSWGGAALCGSCHAINMQAGSHGKHLTYAYDCLNCHNNAGPGTTKHADARIDVAFSGVAGSGGSYSQIPNTPGDGYGSCSSVYCHSNGKVGDTGSSAGSYAAPAWGSTVDCKSCHGTGGASRFGEPDYVNAGAGAADANTHAKHATSAGTCNVCHSMTADPLGGIRVSGGMHVNTVKDVSFSGGGSYTADSKTCSNISCHGTGAPQWGGALNPDCTSCHGNNAASTSAIATGTHPSHMNNTAVLGTNYECARCHSATVSAGDDRTVTGASHANNTKDVVFSESGSYDPTANTCSNLYCHSSGKGTYATVPAWGSGANLGCNSCHGTSGSTGAPDYANAGAGLANANSHAKHTAAGASSCDACHAQTTGAGTAILAGGLHTNSKIDVTFNASKAGTGMYNPADKTCSSTSCHGTATPQWGGTAECGTCHGGTATTQPPIATGTHTAHMNNEPVIGMNFECAQCHKDAAHNSTKEVSFLLGGSYDATANTCSNLYCHSSGKGTYATVPAWGSGANLGCNSCHGTSGSTGAPDYANAGAGLANANSHAKHTAAGASSCDACHAQTTGTGTSIVAGSQLHIVNSRIDVTFNAAKAGPATYNTADKTCSTVSCHGTGTPQWGGALNPDCTSCHGNNAASTSAIATGTHPSHMNNTAVLGTNYACAECHSATVSAGSDRTVTGTVHANNTKDVAFLKGGSYDAGSKTCSATYCHSSGKGTYATVPAWGSGTTLGCNSCHGTSGSTGAPDYANAGAGLANANSHAKHTVEGASSCDACHTQTTGTGTAILAGAPHTDQKIDVTFNATKAGAAAAFTAADKTCSTVACHGAGTPQWGGTVSCQSCHIGEADRDDFSGTFWDNGVAGIIGSGAWESTGHGRPSGTYASGSPAAGFTGTDSCLYCHDDTVAHKVASSPFRLKNTADAAWGKNGNCQSCHAVGSPGVTVGGVTRNGTKKVGSTHFGTRHNTSANGGQFCWDCHDPHGDTNIFMVHDSVAKTSDASTGAPVTTAAASFTAFATGTDYAGGANSMKICNTCHTSVNHYTSTTSDTHNASIRCTQCHKHSGDTRTDAFKPSGENCYDCHSSAGGPVPGTAPDAYHAKHVRTAFVGKVSLGDYGSSAKGWYAYSTTGGTPDSGCGYCHPQSSAAHMDGKIDLNFNPADTGAAGTLKAKNAATPVFTQNSRVNVTCSSVYCHSDGYNSGSGYGYRAAPNWYGGTYAGDKCAGCHSNSPTGSQAHTAHAVGIHYNSIFNGTSGLAAAGNTGTSSHGNAATSTTINCNVCHNTTVTMSANDRNSLCSTCHTGANLKGTMMIAAASTTHVNGIPDVAFTGTSIKSKAQLRNNITSVPELNSSWTRVNGYKQSGSYDQSVQALNAAAQYDTGTKSCNSVACHNGYPVKWTDTGISCGACHKALPQ